MHFNLDRILNTDIIHEPWPYKVIDNILTPETFQTMQMVAAEIAKTDREQIPFDDIWPCDVSRFNLDSSIESLLINMADELLTISKPLLSQFTHYLKSDIGYYNIPRLTYHAPKETGDVGIHDEGITKAMVLIVYLSPNYSCGTQLYKTADPKHFYSEVEWVPNRAMMLISQPGITWHKPSPNYKDKRFTLNFIYEKMEALSNWDIFDDRKLWFLDKMANDRLVSIND